MEDVTNEDAFLGLNLGSKVVLVTGAGGYPGSRLATALIGLGARVRLFDVFPLHASWGEGTPYTASDADRVITADVCDAHAVLQAVDGCDVVFHLASFGMSGKQMLDAAMTFGVNVGGTLNVLDACILTSVKALVYTSTYNVVFAGEEIRNGREDELPYPTGLTCLYSSTKQQAEQIVLAANQCPTKRTGHPLRTVAIRPAGIYGEGEKRHFPRIVSYLQRGLFSFTIGSPESLVDWVYVDNLVYGHVLAAHKLLECNDTCSGQAYFISDDKPMNQFEFFRPFIEGVGLPYPQIRLPLRLMLAVAWLDESVNALMAHVYPIVPFLTRSEVQKTAVTHYMSLDKAKTLLGYRVLVPYEEGMKRLVNEYADRDLPLDPTLPRIAKTVTVVLLALVVYFLYNTFMSS